MPFKNFTNNNSNTPTGGTNIPAGTPNIIPPQINGNDNSDVLDVLINYNEKYKNDGDTLFRDKQIHESLSILMAKTKPNVLLVGDAGTGKTKIVEDLAYKLENKDPLIPENLEGKTIYELPLFALVAGSSFVGSLEKKIKEVIDFASDPDNNAILFIDEIHQLIGNSETYNKIAQILKPSLARGEILCIGATTTQEVNNLLDDPAFNRRFSKVLVDEISKEQTVELLKLIKQQYIKHYHNKVAIADDDLKWIVEYADEYKKAGQHRPDNAITLLDRVMADIIVNYKSLIKKTTDPNILAGLKAIKVYNISEKHIKETASKAVLGKVENTDFDKNKILDALREIKGQDYAINEIINTIHRDSLKLFPRTKPLTMLFAGKSGVGKTQVSKIIAREMYNEKPIILNMQEYHSSASINRIIGSSAGYVGYNSNGELPFDKLDTNPYQIIILDEFEKANPAVQKLFMSVFEEGNLVTSKNKVIDFSKTIIIATTNAANTVEKKTLGFVKEDQSEKSKNNELAQCFEIALLNRFELKVNFNEISESIYKDILRHTYKTEINRINKENPKLKLPETISDDDINKISIETYQTMFGARPAKRAIKKFIEDMVI